jgi:succinoglycan biosynthesis transport protein ExoP
MSNESRVITGELVPSPRDVGAPSHQGGALDIVAGPGPLAGPQSFDVRKFVHHALRGRYLLASFLGLLAGGAFGAAAWKLAAPVYFSEGIVRIAYTMPAVYVESENSRPIANFEQFMLSQRMVITSRRVIEMAMQDTTWRQRGRDVPAGLDEYYAENLKVDIRPRSEFISISITDRDPGMAAAAVVALVNAYADYYNTNERQMERQRLGVLEDRQNALHAEIQRLDGQLRAAAQEYGSTRLDPFYEAAVARLTRLETALADVRLAMAGAHPAPAAPPATATSPQQAAQPSPDGQPATPPADAVAQAAPAAELSPDEIAMTDVAMRTHLDERDRQRNELKRFALLKFGEAHRDVIVTRQLLDDAEARVAAYADRYRKFHAATAAAAASGLPVAPTPGAPASPVAVPEVPLASRPLTSLRASEASLLKLHAETKHEVAALGNRRLELQKLELELTDRKTTHDTLTRRIEMLRAESSLGGRLSIISSGEVPVSPVRDTRLRNAAAGALAGTCVPAALFVLMGFVRRRYRFSDETEDDLAANVPLLGILPEHSGKDAAQNPAAAHSVHQIRVSLASRMARNRSNVYLVTSATAGEGKTTVAVSLALSFAAAKVRTLLVDCDLVGRHLTSSLAGNEMDGMQEALLSGSLLKSVRKTYSGLYILTAGNAAAADAVSIPSDTMHALFAEARKYFQVIIVDSGPILGSLEAVVVAQEADGVIFAITRGQHRELVQRALRRLNGLGTQVVGFIFNRAKPQDFHRSSYGSTTEPARDPDAHLDPAEMWQGESLKRFGPLVQAVASGIRMSDN